MKKTALLILLFFISKRQYLSCMEEFFPDLKTYKIEKPFEDPQDLTELYPILKYFQYNDDSPPLSPIDLSNKKSDPLPYFYFQETDKELVPWIDLEKYEIKDTLEDPQDLTKKYPFLLKYTRQNDEQPNVTPPPPPVKLSNKPIDKKIIGKKRKRKTKNSKRKKYKKELVQYETNVHKLSSILNRGKWIIYEENPKPEMLEQKTSELENLNNRINWYIKIAQKARNHETEYDKKKWGDNDTVLHD